MARYGSFVPDRDNAAPGRPAGPAEVRALAMAGNFFHTAHPHTRTDMRLTLLTQTDIFWEKNFDFGYGWSAKPSACLNPPTHLPTYPPIHLPTYGVVRRLLHSHLRPILAKPTYARMRKITRTADFQFDFNDIL